MVQLYLVSQYNRPLPLSFIEGGELKPRKKVLIDPSKKDDKDLKKYLDRGYVRLQEVKQKIITPVTTEEIITDNPTEKNNKKDSKK